MTQAEFDDWIEYHCGLFPSTFEKFIAFSSEQKNNVRTAWFKVLNRYSLDDALAASDRLLANADRLPKTQIFDRTPGVIKKIILELKGSAQDQRARQFAKFGTETVECPRCLDDGIVSVHARGAEWQEYCDRYSEGYADRVSLSTRCTCQAGDRISSGLRRFNRELDEVWQPEVGHLADWMNQKMDDRGIGILDGVGPATATKFEDAMEKFWASSEARGIKIADEPDGQDEDDDPVSLNRLKDYGVSIEGITAIVEKVKDLKGVAMLAVTDDPESGGPAIDGDLIVSNLGVSEEDAIGVTNALVAMFESEGS